jgi:hypothetical protein
MVTPRLAIDLSGSMIRILVGNPGSPMRCAEMPAPAGSMRGGAVEDSSAVAEVLRQLVARAEVKETRAMIAASDSLASFRILRFAKDITEAKIDSIVRTQLPADGIRMGVQRHEVTVNGAERTVYAVAYDRPKVQELGATVRLAGLEPTVVELKSVCVARATPVAACVVLDLDADPFEIFLIDGHLPRVCHAFKPDPKSPDRLANQIASGLRTVLSYYRRQTARANYGSEVPVLVTNERTMTVLTAATVQELVGHPVVAMPPLPRVSTEIAHGTYLACVGLLMRRR